MQGFRSLSSRRLIVVDDSGENAKQPTMEDSSKTNNNNTAKGGRPILRRFGSVRRSSLDNSSPDRMCTSERIGNSSRPSNLSRRFNNSRRSLMNSQSEPDHNAGSDGRPSLTRRFSNSRRGLMQRQASIGSQRSLKSNKSVKSKSGSAKIASLWDDHEGLEIGKKKEKPAPAPKPSRPSLGKSLSFRKPKSSRNIQVVDDFDDDDNWSKELEEEKKQNQGESFYMKIKRQAEEESLHAGEPGEGTSREEDSEFLGMVIGVPKDQQEDDLGLDDLPDLHSMAQENKRGSSNTMGMSMVLEGSREFESMHGSKHFSQTLETPKTTFRKNKAGDATDDDESSAGGSTKFGDGTTLGDDTTFGGDDDSSVSTVEKEEIRSKIQNLALLARQSSFKNVGITVKQVNRAVEHQAVEAPIMSSRV